MEIYLDPSQSKLIGCNIHGHIRLSKLALTIIDTPEFQRLRNIKQLGLCYLIWPAALHSRFEHSIGVYHLSCKMVEKLQKNYPDRIYDIPELGPTKLTNFIGELIKIGGLCHDIGHGPYSHVFDDIMSDLTSSLNSHHEFRSCLIVEHICHKYLNSVLDGSHIKFIQSIINPGPTHIGAIYQIVANYLNGIDVDKFDYLARDSYVLGIKSGFDPRRIIDEIIIDNRGNIAYPKQCAVEIYDMFQTRMRMHRQVYNHKATKLLELMIYDIIKKVDPVFKISSTIYDMEKFCQLDDHSIWSMLELTINPPFYMLPQISPNDLEIVRGAYQLYRNIVQRKLYKCIMESSDTDSGYFENIIDDLKNLDIPTNSLHIVTIKIGFVSGAKKNPFDSIYFYDRKDPNAVSFIIEKNNHTETHHFLICKDRLIYPKVLLACKEYTNKNKL
jgi:HD superfamily phosphohydrolase